MCMSWIVLATAVVIMDCNIMCVDALVAGRLQENIYRIKFSSFMNALVMIHVWLLRFPFHSSNDTTKVVIYMLSS